MASAYLLPRRLHVNFNGLVKYCSLSVKSPSSDVINEGDLLRYGIVVSSPGVYINEPGVQNLSQKLRHFGSSN